MRSDHLSSDWLPEVTNNIIIGKFKMSAQRVAAYERWSPRRGSSYSDFIEKILVFRKSGADGRWSLLRVGSTGRFDCIFKQVLDHLQCLCRDIKVSVLIPFPNEFLYP